MKKLILCLMAIVILLSGCNKEQIPTFDLVVCDSTLNEMYTYLSDFENDSFKVKNSDINDDQVDEIKSFISENRDYITSITIYSKNITEDTAKRFISFAKQSNIPVIFAFSEISLKTLESYDKAFCITSDYIHAGEITAEEIKQLWTSGTITDTNQDKIFSFSVIKSENENQQYENFYQTLIKHIELYGIPMQINSIVSPEEITDLTTLSAFKAENEGVIVISETILPLLKEYSTENQTIGFITVQQSPENQLAENSYTLDCFIDYKNYKIAVDEILKNYNNMQYPLIELSFPVMDRTVFIPATI